jgi:hypothetical protein
MIQRAGPFVLSALFIGGCSSAPEPYPGSDVVEVPGFELVRATDLRLSGGTLRSGMLEYSGEGDLKEVFREHVQAMAAQGWTPTQTNIDDHTATAVLRKDSRMATLNFNSTKKNVTAVIRVSEATTPEAR